MLECRFAEFLYLGLPLSFKAQFLPQIKGGFRRTKCHVVAQTQGYHLVCIWGSLVKFQGGGVVVKTMICARVQICCVFVPGLTRLSKLNVSLKLRGRCVWLGVMLLHRHRAIIWYAFGVAWLNSRGVGLL